MMMRIGSPTDILWSALLNSNELGYYVEENQRRLGKGYAFLTNWLKGQGIPFREANAGHFLLADFSKVVEKVVADGKKEAEAITTEQEVELLNRLVDGGVYLGPGVLFDFDSTRSRCESEC